MQMLKFKESGKIQEFIKECEIAVRLLVNIGSSSELLFQCYFELTKYNIKMEKYAIAINWITKACFHFDRILLKGILSSVGKFKKFRFNYYHGVCLVKLDKHHEAVDYFVKSLAENELYIGDTLCALGNCLTHLEDYSSALSYFDQSFKPKIYGDKITYKDYEQVDAIMGKVHVYDKLENYKEALKYCVEAIHMDYWHQEAYGLAARYLKEFGDETIYPEMEQIADDEEFCDSKKVEELIEKIQIFMNPIKHSVKTTASCVGTVLIFIVCLPILIPVAIVNFFRSKSKK
jgi:tetratricopeptide (TPR) repeat protein